MNHKLKRDRGNSRRLRVPVFDLSWMLRVPMGAATCRALSRWFPLAPSITELVMRLEDAFGVRIPPWRVEQWGGMVANVTAGELHSWICEELKMLKRSVPRSSWHRVQKVIAELGGIAPTRIRPDSLLDAHLRLFEGG